VIGVLTRGTITGFRGAVREGAVREAAADAGASVTASNAAVMAAARRPFEHNVAPADLVFDTMSASDSVAGSCEPWLEINLLVMDRFLCFLRGRGPLARMRR
jgi:uncharacterized protein with von Willebrand factor type A (vWA) domain